MVVEVLLPNEYVIFEYMFRTLKKIIPVCTSILDPTMHDFNKEKEGIYTTGESGSNLELFLHLQ